MKSLEIQLKEDEVKFLKAFIKKGNKKAREILRANILLVANKGEKDTRIAEILSTHRQTVWRIKKRYIEEGLKSALKDKPRSGQPKKYEIKHETEIAAIACTAPPEGRKKWTLELLQEELRTREGFETINRESIRLILKKQHKALAKTNVVHSENGF
jgi:transposase